MTIDPPVPYPSTCWEIRWGARGVRTLVDKYAYWPSFRRINLHLNGLKGFGEHLLKAWRRHDQECARHRRECFDGFNGTLEGDPASDNVKDRANRTEIRVRELSAKRMSEFVPNSVEPHNPWFNKGCRCRSIRKELGLLSEREPNSPWRKSVLPGSTGPILCTRLRPMAMGTTRDDGSQQAMWVATADLPQGGGHPFYERLNEILGAAGFDAFVEKLCAPFYARMGRPSLAPGRYFRLLLVGYFEGLDSERAIAWRAADSLSLRSFLRLAPPSAPPDHSTISRTRRLLSVETHEAVFTWVLQQLADAGLVRGRTVGIDATTLEANAALRSIVRRETGEDYTTFLTRLAEASGIATPTRAELARFDRSRKKKTSNAEWTHPHDPDARVTKMKDGRTHLAHKAEHTVDLETGAVVGVTVQGADTGDTASMVETLIAAAEQVDAVLPDGPGIEEVVGDKGYHSNETMADLKALGLRSYISEPDRGRRCWKQQQAARDAVYANRRRIRGERGRRLLRCRGELLERPFAHVCETGGMRRVHLRGHPNVRKRLLVHVAGCNLGLLLRQMIGVGTPRSLQGRPAALFRAPFGRFRDLWDVLRRSWALFMPTSSSMTSPRRDESVRSVM